MKIKKYIIYAVSTAVLFTNAAFALDETAPESTPKKVFTIEECINMGVKNDPNVKIAKDTHDVYKSKVGQAKSDYFPKINLGNSYNFSASTNSGGGNFATGTTTTNSVLSTVTNNLNDTSSSSNTTNRYTLNAGINQLIWNFGRTTANINMQKFNYEATKYDWDNAVLDRTYKIRIAYYRVLAAKAYQDISERSVQINKINYNRTKALFEEGLKSKIDVVNSEVYYTDSQIQLIEAQNTYQLALITLANTMFYTDSLDFMVTNTENFNYQKPVYKAPDLKKIAKNKNSKDDNSEQVLTSGIKEVNRLENFTFKPLTINVDDAVKQAYSLRPDLKSLKLVAKASEQSLRAVKLTPTPEITANAGYNLGVNSNNTTNALTVGASFSFPQTNLMDWKYKIDEAKSYLDIANENVNLSEKNIYFEIHDYYVAMHQLEKKIPLMAQKVEQTLENFKLADGRYTVGLGNFIELQDAQTNYNNAQLEFIQCVFNYNVAREEFQKAMGVI